MFKSSTTACSSVVVRFLIIVEIVVVEQILSLSRKVNQVSSRSRETSLDRIVEFQVVGFAVVESTLSNRIESATNSSATRTHCRSNALERIYVEATTSNAATNHSFFVNVHLAAVSDVDSVSIRAWPRIVSVHLRKVEQSSCSAPARRHQVTERSQSIRSRYKRKSPQSIRIVWASSSAIFWMSGATYRIRFIRLDR